jgi:hypothetical protein
VGHCLFFNSNGELSFNIAFLYPGFSVCPHLLFRDSTSAQAVCARTEDPMSSFHPEPQRVGL